MAPERDYSETSLHLMVVLYLKGIIKKGGKEYQVQAPFPGLLYCHPNNEQKDKQEAAWGWLKGVLAGVPDFIMWERINGIPQPMAIELKKPGKNQAPTQRTFQYNFEQKGGLYAVCRSVGEVRDTLIRWGLACKNTNAIEPKPTHSEMLAFQKAMHTPV